MKYLVLLLLTFNSYANLTESNFNKSKECLGKAESNNDWKAVNRLGYLGRYQFGAQALEDVGFINKGCYAKYKNSVPKSCWKVGSRKSFLNNKTSQNLALKRLFNRNHKRLVYYKVLSKSSTQSQIAQALFVSHLLGAYAAKKYFKNKIDGKDANGTTASKYAKIAEKCIEEES